VELLDGATAARSAWDPPRARIAGSNGAVATVATAVAPAAAAAIAATPFNRDAIE
jgi:hypothetical protein